MRSDLDAALVGDFPYLFALLHQDADECSMSRGFACGDGWEGIIRRLAEKLEPLAASGALRATQVKEKFGTLRFLLARGCEPLDDLSRMIHEAEKESQRTCEECSAPGTMQRITGRRECRYS